MKKLFMGLLCIVMITVISASWVLTTHADESEETVSFILHKLQGTTNTEMVQNTGEEMDPELFYGAEGAFKVLPDVEFTVFDISSYFYDLRANEKSTATMDDVIEYLNELNLIVVNDQLVTKDGDGISATKIGNQRTNDAGQAVFELPANHGTNQGKVYVFVETAAPAEVKTKSSALIVGLPVLGSDSQPLTVVHLYPKNFLSYGSLEGMKVVQDITDGDIHTTPLANAKFYIHQTGTDFVSKETLVLSTLANGVRTWVEQDAENAAIFISESDGSLMIPSLAEGSYLLTEISTTFGDNTTALNSSVVNIPFTIIANEKTTLSNPLLNDNLNVKKSNAGTSYMFGDRIDYTVIAAIPTGIQDEERYTKFSMTDTHHEHLSFVEGSLIIKAGDTLINDHAYNFTQSDNTFTIDFIDPATTLAAHGNQVLTIDYQMMVTTSAIPDTNMNNDVTMTTDWDSETDTGEAVFTGGKRFVKIDGHSKATLEGAKFYITNEASHYLAVTDEGYTWSTNPSDENMVHLTSNKTGVFEITGLAYGKYILHEFETSSEAYILPTDGFPFEITEHSYLTTSALPAETQEIENYTKGFLPATGGIGIVIFLLLGSLTMGGTVYWLKKAS